MLIDLGSCRLVQFAAQFLAWYTSRKGYNKDTTQRWRNLLAAVATSRRREFVMRGGTIWIGRLTLSSNIGFSCRRLWFASSLPYRAYPRVHACGLEKLVDQGRRRQIPPDCPFRQLGPLVEQRHACLGASQNRHYCLVFIVA